MKDSVSPPMIAIAAVVAIALLGGIYYFTFGRKPAPPPLPTMPQAGGLKLPSGPAGGTGAPTGSMMPGAGMPMSPPGSGGGVSTAPPGAGGMPMAPPPGPR